MGFIGSRVDSIAVFFTESQKRAPASSSPAKSPPGKDNPCKFSAKEVKTAKKEKYPEGRPPLEKSSPSKFKRGRLAVGRLLRFATRNTEDNAQRREDARSATDVALSEINVPLDDSDATKSLVETATEDNDGRIKAFIAKVTSGVYFSSRRKPQPEPWTPPVITEEEKQQLIEFGGYRGILSDRADKAPFGPGPSNWWTNLEP